jgi:hypothetical protein
MTRADVVQAYVDAGQGPEVADCVVGVGSREFDLIDLDPRTALEPGRQALRDELLDSCINAASLTAPVSAEPPSLAFSSEPHDFGDDPHLDELWVDCEQGDGRACDDLFEQAPVASVYEEFGVTCGRRADVLDCASLAFSEQGESESTERN